MKKAIKNALIIISVLLAMFLIGTLSFTGCGSQEVVTSEEAPSDDTETGPEDEGAAEETTVEEAEDTEEEQQAEEMSTAFSADGTISDGEYKYSTTFEDFDISWSNDSEFVYIAMKAETEGYVSVAVQPGEKMNEADIITGWVTDGQPGIVDMFSTGNFGPHPPDIELGGTDDIAEFGGKEDGGFTVIEFKRALNTTDEYDNELVKGTNQIIWAYATSDDPGAKHKFRGYGEITIE
jgi:hypothetical protein